MNIKNKKTYYQIILDKSGSMTDCIDSTINGFNEQMQMIKSLQYKFPDSMIQTPFTKRSIFVSSASISLRPSAAKTLPQFGSEP